MELFEKNGIHKIGYKDASEFLLPRHYSGRIPSISYAYGYYEDSILKAVVTYGKPASHSLCVGVCGEEYSSQVYELNRLCRDGDIAIPISKLVSHSLRELSKESIIVVSYADTQANHHGYIYQATNFIYTGATKSRTDKWVEGNKHSRHYSNEEQGKYRKVRSSKHRYIYFCGSKSFKRACKKALNYEQQPYPKGDNDKDYKLGVVMQPKIIKSNVSTRRKQGSKENFREALPAI